VIVIPYLPKYKIFFTSAYKKIREVIHTPTLKYYIGGSVFALQVVLSACNVVWHIVQMFS